MTGTNKATAFCKAKAFFAWAKNPWEIACGKAFFSVEKNPWENLPSAKAWGKTCLVAIALLLLCSVASAVLLVSISPKEPETQNLLLYQDETGDYRVDVFNDSKNAVNDVLIKVSASEGLKIIDAGFEKASLATEIESLGAGEKISLIVTLKPIELSTNKLFVYVDYGTGEYTNMSATYISVEDNLLVITSSISKASLDMGEEGLVYLSMRNNGSGPVRNINAELIAFEGIESRSAPVFVAELAPGEGYEAKAFAFRPDPEVTGKKPLVLQVTFEDSLGRHVIEKDFSVEIQSRQTILLLIGAIIILLVVVAILSRRRGTKIQSKLEKPIVEEIEGKKIKQAE